MGEHLVSGVITVLSAIVGVAIIAVLVSRQAQTGTVISSAGSAFANDISAAIAPVTGAQAQINTGGGNSFGFSGLGSPIPSVNY